MSWLDKLRKTKTVTSIAEWDAYAAHRDEPRAHLVGDLADQLREVWGVNKHVPVVMYEEDWGRDDLWCSCCESSGTDLIIECDGHRLPFDASPYRRDPDELPRWLEESRRRIEKIAADEARAAARREQSELVDRAQLTTIAGALDAVEAEGYEDDADWHDKLMGRLGVKGYQ